MTACTGKGGAGHSLFYICNYIDRDVVEPLVVMPSDGVIGPKLREIGVSVLLRRCLRERFYELRFRRNNFLTRALSYLWNAWDSLIFVFQLASIARQHAVDAIYCNHMMVKIMGTLAGVLSGRPVILHCRTIYSNFLERSLYVSAAALPHVRRIIAVSDAAAANFRALSNKVRVVRNGVPLEGLSEAASSRDVRKDFGIPESSSVVGFVGRLVPWKGIDLLLDAAETLVRKRPDLILLLVGDVPVGSTRASLDDYRADASARGLEGRVLFAGFQPNPSPFLCTFDTLVVPSISADPCPRVVVEAMALGTPVIGSDAGGIPEVIEHEVSGLLVRPRNAGDIVAQVGRILDDAELRDRIIAEADRRVRRDYDAAHVAKRIQGVLLEALRPGTRV